MKRLLVALLNWNQATLCRWGWHPADRITMETWMGPITSNLHIRVYCGACRCEYHRNSWTASYLEKLG